jgi:hypothetical protein
MFHPDDTGVRGKAIYLAGQDDRIADQCGGVLR